MSDGAYHGIDDKPYDFRLDIPTVRELGGTAPTIDAKLPVWGGRKMLADDRSPNKDESPEDKIYDIELTIGGVHPYNLLPDELAEYTLKSQVVFKRSTTPRDAQKSAIVKASSISDFDDI